MFVCKMDSLSTGQKADNQRTLNGPHAEHAHEEGGDETLETEIDSFDDDAEEEYVLLGEDEIEPEIEELIEEEQEYEDEEALEELEEDEHEENGVIHEIQQVTEERIPTQVPKKMKVLEASTDDGMAEEKDATTISSESRRSGAGKAQVNEKQCRVCTATDDLVSLFKTVETQTAAEMLMTICTSVTIARKDFMPQFICRICLNNVTTAVKLKEQCETTERMLRKQLPRSKNKVRRRPAYVDLDATPDSDPALEGDEELNDDAEFKVSDDLMVDDDSVDSDFSAKRRKPTRTSTGRKRGRPRKNPLPSETPIVVKQRTAPAIKKEYNVVEYNVPVKREYKYTSVKREYSRLRKSSIELDPDFSSADERKKNRSSMLEDSVDGVYPCDQCSNVYARKFSLLQHMKAHVNRKIIVCKICGKQFKIAGAYRTHLEKHKMDAIVSYKCNQCDKVFPSKAEMRCHVVLAHGESEQVYQCDKCRRTFLSEARLINHQETTCRGPQIVRIVCRTDDKSNEPELFKKVAPLTSTYWSDSYSD